MEIERLPSSEFQPKSVVFEDVFGLLPLFDAIAFKANVILSGPKGVGKSLAVLAFAKSKGCPVVTCDCSEDLRRTNLLGTFVLRGKETPFILGPVPTAFEIANECGQCVLCLEEINALTPQLQKVFNPVTDFRQRIEIPECKRVFRLTPGTKLWVVGTMNTSVYGGVYALNEDLKSRFRIVALNYPSQDAERKIVLTVLSAAGVQVVPNDVEQVLLLAKESRAGNALEYALSTRDVIQILEDIAFVGRKKALWIARGKFEDADRTTIDARIRSIFGIDFTKP
jgi:MoxR-like ATPase